MPQPVTKLARLPSMSRGVDRQRVLAEIRNSLPVTEYLSVLHTLALTGQMPCYDPPAAPNLPPTRTGQFTPPDRQLQHKTLTYLLDKAFAPIERPAAARVADTANADDPTEGLLADANAARQLTVGELVRRISAQSRPAEIETEPNLV